MRTVLITAENPFKTLADLYESLTRQQEWSIDGGIILTRKAHGWVQTGDVTSDRFKVGKSVEGGFLDALENDDAICFAMDEFTTDNRLEVRALYEGFFDELKESSPELTDSGVIKGKVLIAPDHICALFTDTPETVSDE